MSTRGHDTNDSLDLDNCNLDFKIWTIVIFNNQFTQVFKFRTWQRLHQVDSIAWYVHAIFSIHKKCSHVCCAYHVFTKH